MKKLIRNLLLVLVAVLLVSPVVTNISRASMLTTNQTVCLDDPNDPGIIPEMVPNISTYYLIEEDPNDPGSIPE